MYIYFYTYVYMIYDIWYMIYDIWYMICITNDTLHFSYLYIDIWFLYNKRNVRSLWHFSLDDLYFLANRSGAVEVRSPGGRSAADEGRIGSRAAGSPAGHGEGVVCKRKKTVDFFAKNPEICFPVRFHFVDFLWGQSCCGLPGQGRIARNHLRQKTQELL